MSRFTVKRIVCKICKIEFKTFQIKTGVCPSCQKIRNDKKYYNQNRLKFKKNSKEYRDKNKKQIKKRNRIYYIKNKDTISKKQRKKYRDTTKAIPKEIYLKSITKPLHLWITSCGKNIKEKARILLQRAVRKERIIKPNKCSCCKRKLPKRLIHAHHENYNKWWDIIWLCQTCHSELHIKMILKENK